MILTKPVFHLTLIQQLMAIGNNGIKNLLLTEHLRLEQLRKHKHRQGENRKLWSVIPKNLKLQNMIILPLY